MRRRGPLPARRVFVDTSAYFALTDYADADHATSQTLLQRLAVTRSHVFTSNLIVAETHALLLSRLNAQIARQFLDDLRQSRTTTLVWITPSDFEHAYEIIATYDDKDFSLTDATSFVVMERLKITHAFTLDHHFTQYGLTVLTPDSF